MSSPIIVAEDLGKKYTLSHQTEGPRYKTLRDTVATTASGLFRRKDPQNLNGNSARREEFWALKDLSFEINQGEVVGVIGRNGAGKSTLLKLLSRITEPTSGRIRLRGRVACLLEVGTGFHPELTGRENIFLNGAILGMQRHETQRKFDEIVAFAEVEQFLDTPVKRYSSGMYVKLAFAVAAHLEPEILIVDEVLAVGDAAFQKKCLGKMSDVARTGRTILFVSHNMAAVINLCSRAIVLDGGRLITDSAVQKGIDSYLTRFANTTTVPLSERMDRKGNQALVFEDFHLEGSNCQRMSRAISGEDITFVFRYRCPDGNPVRGVHVALGVHGQFDQDLFHMATSTVGIDFEELAPNGEIRCVMPRVPLQAGTYTLNIFSTIQGEIADWIQGCCLFEVDGGDFFGTGRLPITGKGPFLVDHSWKAASRV